MREDVHPRRVKVAEPRFVGLVLSVDEVLRRRKKFGIYRLHSLGRQRPGILDLAVSIGMQHAARAKLLAELRVLRIVGVLRLLFSVEVVKVTEELVEAMRGR